MKSTTPFVKRYFKKLSGRVILLLLLITGTVFLFGLITHEVLWEKEEALDMHVFNWLSMHVISPQLTFFMKKVTYCASSRFLQVAYALIVISYMAARDWKRAIEIAVVGLGGFLVNYFMKLSFERTRPYNPLVEPLQNFSYPSGHATSGFIFYGLVVYLVWKSSIADIYKYVAAVVLIFFSILIGVSRVYLRLHYTSDVIAGFCVGFIWLFLCVWLMEYLKKKAAMELN